MLKGAIAAEFPGLGPPGKLPVGAAFMWALQAKAREFRRYEMLIDASCFPHRSDRFSAQMTLDGIHFMGSGPGRPVAWKDTLTAAQRADLEQCEVEVDETLALLRAAGVPLPKEGEELSPESVATASVKAKMGHRVGQSVGAIKE